MLIYILLLISTILVNYTVKISRIKNQRKAYAILMGCIFFFIAAARDFSVGGDLVNYFRAYRIFGELNLVEAITRIGWEPGYILLNKLIAYLTQSNERALIVFIAIITTVGLSRFIYRQSKYQWLSWYLFISMGFIIYPYSALRAVIAMIIGLNGLSYLIDNFEYAQSKEKKNRRKVVIGFYSYVLIAVLFHKTAIVYGLVYPLSKLKITTKYYLFIGTIFLSGYVFGARILEYIAYRFYPSYLTHLSVSDGGYALFLLLFIVLLLGKLFVPNTSKKHMDYIILNHVLTLALGLQLITFRFSLFSRVVEFFSVCLIIYIPYIVFNMKKNDRLIAVLFISVASLYLFYDFLTGSDLGGVIPYKFFWQ